MLDIYNIGIWHILFPHTNQFCEENNIKQYIDFLNELKEKGINIEIPWNDLEQYLKYKNDISETITYIIPHNNYIDIKITEYKKEYEIEVIIKEDKMLSILYEKYKLNKIKDSMKLPHSAPFFIKKEENIKKIEIILFHFNSIYGKRNIMYITDALIYNFHIKYSKENYITYYTIYDIIEEYWDKYIEAIKKVILKDVLDFPVYIHKDILIKLNNQEIEIVKHIFITWELNQMIPHWYWSNSSLRTTLFEIKIFLMKKILKLLEQYDWDNIYSYYTEEDAYWILFFEILWRQISFHYVIGEIATANYFENIKIKPQQWVWKRTKENLLGMSDKRYKVFLQFQPEDVNIDFFWENIFFKDLKEYLYNYYTTIN